MAVDRNEAIALFERAIQSEIGISMTTDNSRTLRQELYLHMRELADPRYASLQFAVMSTTEVFIVKKTVSL